MRSPLAFTFRPVTPQDEDVLVAIYASTRWEELQVTGWTDSAKHMFLRQQYQFQTTDWSRNYPLASRQIIMVGDEPAGRLYIDRNEVRRDLRIIDVALLPDFRNRGIGTAIFRQLFTEADARGWRVSIHVEENNPAKQLYARLGFAPHSSTGVYLLMERPPVSETASVAQAS